MHVRCNTVRSTNSRFANIFDIVYIICVIQGVPDDATAATATAAATASDGRSDAWSEYYKRPALSRALKVLAGVCKGHTASQQVLDDD
jgi:E3 ubiquitin-protein ligase UBR4